MTSNGSASPVARSAQGCGQPAVIYTGTHGDITRPLAHSQSHVGHVADGADGRGRAGGNGAIDSNLVCTSGRAEAAPEPRAGEGVTAEYGPPGVRRGAAGRRKWTPRDVSALGPSPALCLTQPRAPRRRR